MNALERHFVNSIKARGPMSIATWMQDCLTHPRFGYYTKSESSSEVLGQRGDFVTSVELSPLFCSVVGVWARHARSLLESGARGVVLAELGPGSGALAAAAARALQRDGGNVRVWLVERSAAMRRAQTAQLSAVALSTPPRWFDSAAELLEHHEQHHDDDVPVLALAHEYFDALPVYRFARRGAHWCEELLDVAPGSSALPLRPVLSRGPTPPVAVCLGPRSCAVLPPDAVAAEVSPDAQSDMRRLGAVLSRSGGAALVVDYGGATAPMRSLRAIRRHQLLPDPFAAPAGECDLSVDVDFGALARAANLPSVLMTQRAFLRSMGAELLLVQSLKHAKDEQEAEMMISQYNRVVDEMGEVYKVLMVSTNEKLLKDFKDIQLA